MKRLVFLLLVSMTNDVVCRDRNEAEFFPEHLQPDLEAIENYFNKFNKNIYAFVHWPKDITFVVSYNSNNHLKIEGKFTDESKRKFTAYEGLYYKQGNFYVVQPKKTSLHHLPKNTPLCYFQSVPKIIPQTDHYASIRYFDFDEIKEMIKQSSLYNYMSHLVSDFTSTYYYLAIAPGFEHFIEYNICRDFYSPPGADGKLRVLIPREKNPRKLSKNVEAEMLQLGSPITTLSVYTADGEWPLANVFGVRMATIGFLAEVKGSKIKMFNSDDLTSDEPPKHVIFGIDFMSKVREVEPEHMNPDMRVCNNYKNRPTSSYFHILGHILEKKVHFVNDEKDVRCPLIVEHANNNGYFMYGEERVDKLCASDSQLWVINGDEKKVTLNELDITLMYQE